MFRISNFTIAMIAFTCLIAFILACAIGSLFPVPGLNGFLTSLCSKEMLYSLSLSIATGFFSSIFVMASAIPVAYVFSRVPFTGKSVIRAVLYLPIALPEIVLGLSLLMFFGDNFAGRFLKAFNIDVAFTITGIITAQFFTALPYTVRIIKTSFDGIDPQLENVAQSLGYSQIRILFAVTLPLAKNGLKAAAAVAFARTIGAFGSVLILAGGIRMNTETLPITLFLNISYGNVDMAITAGIVLISVAFAGILFIEKAENTRGEHS